MVLARRRTTRDSPIGVPFMFVCPPKIGRCTFAFAVAEEEIGASKKGERALSIMLAGVLLLDYLFL